MIETILIILGAAIAVLGGILKFSEGSRSRKRKDRLNDPYTDFREEIDTQVEEELDEIDVEKQEDIEKYLSSDDILAGDANGYIDRIRQESKKDD